VAYKEAFFDEDINCLCIVMDFADDGDLYAKILNHRKNHTSFEESEIWMALVHMVRGLK
jgi:NIMA (never in mitosis gene a)-related kinase